MSLRSPRTDLHPSSIQRTFTSFGSQIVLADQLEASGALSPNGAPAAGINHLPSNVFIHADAADVFAWTDLLGNANSITFAVAFTGELPFTIKTIETTTTVVAVVCSWHPEA